MGDFRYKAGLTLFVGGHLILLAGVLMPLFGLAGEGGAKLAGALVLGGEVIAMASIVFLGKEGFLKLKSKLTGAVKEGYEAPVGPLRHYLGLILFFTNVAVAYFILYYAWVSFGAATPEMPMTEVWGLGLAQQWDMLLTLFLVGEISFLVSLYVLGADWWGRFRNLIVWSAADR